MSGVSPHRWNRCQRAAVWLAALPMVAGFAVLGLWFATDWDVLPVAGIFTIWFGLAVTLAVLALVPVGWAFAAQSGATFRQCLVPAVLALSLMVASYPAAWFCLDTAIARETRFTVTVRNDADSPWGELRLVGPGVDESLGVLAPKATVRRQVWFAGEGAFVLQETVGGAMRDHYIEGYVCSGLGGGANVSRGADGVVRVVRPDVR